MNVIHQMTITVWEYVPDAKQQTNQKRSYILSNTKRSVRLILFVGAVTKAIGRIDSVYSTRTCTACVPSVHAETKKSFHFMKNHFTYDRGFFLPSCNGRRRRRYEPYA